MFSLGFGKAQRGKTIAVADIGGASAGVAIIVTSPKGPARIVALERATLPMEERSAKASASGVVAQLAAAADKALASYTAKTDKEASHIESAYAVIRAPWSRSKTARVEKSFPEQTKIDGRLLSTLAGEALNNDKEFDHLKMLEGSVIRVELNGYPTGQPEGKEVRQVALSALLSECDPTVRSGVSEALQKTFSCPPPKLRSGTRALLAVLRESEHLFKDCLIVNMTSNATNLIVIRKGVVADVVHVPEGSWTIAKRIAGKKMPEEVFTLVRLLMLDQCEGEACEAIKSAMAKVEPDLSKTFGEAFAKMTIVRRLPNALILLVPDDLAEWLSQFFSRIDFAQFTVTTRPFSIRPSIREELEHMVILEGDAAHDPGLCIASALVNIEEQPK